jgi:hypothetical protein
MTKETKKGTIEEMLTELQELVIMQEKALRTADSLLHLKDCIIEILEEQKKINEKENKILKICFFGLIACHILSAIISFFL